MPFIHPDPKTWQMLVQGKRPLLSVWELHVLVYSWSLFESWYLLPDVERSPYLIISCEVSKVGIKAKYQHQISTLHYLYFSILFLLHFFKLLMKACEIDQLSESDGIKNRRGVVYEVVKVIHQKWISRNIFRWVCDEMHCFSFLMCVEVKLWYTHTHIHTHRDRGFALLGVFCHARGSAGGGCEASGTEDNV